MSRFPLSLEVNPNAKISILDADRTPSFLIEAPVKGASLSSVRVCAKTRPGAYEFLRSVLIEGREHTEIAEQDAAELLDIGLFALPGAIPTCVEYRIPLRKPSQEDSLHLRSFDDLSATRELELPDEWRHDGLHFVSHHGDSVWAPVRVPEDFHSGHSRDSAAQESVQVKATLDSEETRAHFEREGFAILENLLPGEHVHELGRYYRELAEQGFLCCHSDRGIRRYAAHNHPVARFWHAQLNERVSQLAGARTKPSYSFVSLYLAGGDLYWHTDRPPCEFTVALLLDYSPLESDGRSAWALRVQRRDGTILPIYQRVGEALILRGRELPHGRDVLPEGHASASLLFHFVHEDYDGTMD